MAEPGQCDLEDQGGICWECANQLVTRDVTMSRDVEKKGAVTFALGIHWLAGFGGFGIGVYLRVISLIFLLTLVIQLHRYYLLT